MSEFIKALLSLSLSGTLLILLLLLFRPLYGSRLSKRWQYYIWLIVIARLLLPVTAPANLMNGLFHYMEQTIGQIERFGGPDTMAEESGGFATDNSAKTPSAESAGNPSNADKTPDSNQAGTSYSKDASETAKSNSRANVPRLIAALWLIIALLLLVRKITIYQSFVKYVRAGSKPVNDIALLERFGQILAKNQVRKHVELSVNHLVSSPLLIGFWHPHIILPDTDLSADDFYYTVIHELTHYKRRDMYYKWVIQLTICLHWFNPFVYRMEKEINRLCELSCDERVIRSLSEKARKSYGDTLLNAIGIGGSYKDALASVTLKESKELLKGRLDAIMKYKNKSTAAMTAAFIAALMLLFAAACLGAYTSYASYAGSDNAQYNPPRKTTSSPAPNEMTPPESDRFLFDESTDSYVYTDTAGEYKIIHQDNIYRILAGGATIYDCPSGVVSDDGILLTLVYPDQYFSFLFNSSDSPETITREILGHCSNATSEGRMTKEQADLMAAATGQIAKWITQESRPAGQPEQNTDPNPYRANRIINGKGKVSYVQSAYYKPPYLIELGWNLPAKSQKAYDCIQVSLADNSAMPVFFDASCSRLMSDSEAVSSIAALLTDLSDNENRKSQGLPINTPFIVHMEYIGGADLDLLAKDYYEQEKLTYFSAVFPELDLQTQLGYLEQQFNEDDISFFVCSIAALEGEDYFLETVERYLLKSYQDDAMDYFAVLAGILEEYDPDSPIKDEWIRRCRKDGQTDYLYLLDDFSDLDDDLSDE